MGCCGNAWKSEGGLGAYSTCCTSPFLNPGEVLPLQGMAHASQQDKVRNPSEGEQRALPGPPAREEPLPLKGANGREGGKGRT